MSKTPLLRTALYFTTVVALPDSSVVVGGHLVAEEDDPSGTLVLRVSRGRWNLIARPDEVIYSTALDRRSADANPQLGILGREGYFSIADSTTVLNHDKIQAMDPGYLEGLACIDGDYYACGAQKRVVRRAGSGWSRIDQQIYVPFVDIPGDFLLSIDGRSAREIYVCGSQGFLARWDGSKWSVIDCPTNVELNAVYCASSGDTYFCGSAGSLFRLRPDGAVDDLTELRVARGALYDICEFKGSIFIAGGDRLLRLGKQGLEVVPPPAKEKVAIYAISANDSLWCAGDENLREFSGQDWVTHECPANRKPP